MMLPSMYAALSGASPYKHKGRTQGAAARAAARFWVGQLRHQEQHGT